MAERANARETLEIKGGSHVVFISYADTVAAMIVLSIVFVIVGGVVVLHETWLALVADALSFQTAHLWREARLRPSRRQLQAIRRIAGIGNLADAL